MNESRGWSVLALVAGLTVATPGAAQSVPPPVPPPKPAAAASAVLPPVSLSARKVYEQARSQLVQIRTVLKGQASQTSVGSGFVVSTDGHIVTNYHVVSEAALHPERHDLVYVTADGKEAPVQLLMIDVLHDLAVLRVDPSSAGSARPLVLSTQSSTSPFTSCALGMRRDSPSRTTAELASVMTVFPQVLINVRLAGSADGVMASPAVKAAVTEAEQRLGRRARVVPSHRRRPGQHQQSSRARLRRGPSRRR